MLVSEVVAIAHATAKEKGFWPTGKAAPRSVFEAAAPTRCLLALVSEKLALIHSEVTEALEEVRGGTAAAFAEELADVIIRTADLAGALEIDLAAAVAAKLEKNKTRGPLHGKRF